MLNEKYYFDTKYTLPANSIKVSKEYCFCYVTNFITLNFMSSALNACNIQEHKCWFQYFH